MLLSALLCWNRFDSSQIESSYAECIPASTAFQMSAQDLEKNTCTLRYLTSPTDPNGVGTGSPKVILELLLLNQRWQQEEKRYAQKSCADV